MPTMMTCKCANKSCRAEFQARAADRVRGWGKFCSKSCKAIHQERRTGQHAAHHYRQQIRGMNGGKSADDLQREFGGNPEFDRHGRYVGFTLSGDGHDINTEHPKSDLHDR